MNAFSALGLLLCSTSAFAAAPGHAISFRNDVMAVLSKAGCNAGTCHGNANGKAGFKLSLRGESPELDYHTLAREFAGRRVDPFDPDQSLVLRKATTQLAHEGGKRFGENSWEYAVLRDWIAQGARADAPGTPTLQKLEVTPATKIVYDPEAGMQIAATATFSDGSWREVTKVAVYETANTLAKVSPEGRAERTGFGETTVLVRYLDQQLPVRLAFVPERPEFVRRKVPAVNYIDEHIFAKLDALRINPSELAGDEVFLRRAYLDLLGVLPSPEEARKFVSDKRKNKRPRLVDELLERPEYADFWALKWGDLLRNEGRALDQKGVENFHHWIRQSLAENKPLDQFIREIISARGSTYRNPAANFHRANRDPIERAVATAQVFLGTRLQCAQCHSHPFDRWTQNDYYSWSAAFSKIGYKVVQNRRRDSNDSHEFKGEQIVYAARRGEVKNPKTGKAAPPNFLGADRYPAMGEPDDLDALAAWITSARNSFFARTQVNRLWFNLMGRGLVDPIDDFRPTNPPTHPELLEALTRDFVAHKFDARHVIRLIMNSRAYQLTSEPNATNKEDETNYSRNLIRRLTAEQLLDNQAQVLGVPLRIQGAPAGARAAQMPGANTERRRGEKISAPEKFLEIFGKPQRLLTCECERSSDTTMNQAFLMITGPALNDMLTSEESRLSRLSETNLPIPTAIEELYWSALTRPPTVEEMVRNTQLIANAKNRRAALEDLAWSLLNAKEFVFRR